MPNLLTLDQIKDALAGTAAAFRSITEYQPAGGPGDKIFPATYEGGTYATETRYIDGQEVPCVLIDSVQSQANRMELALLDAWEAGEAPLPVAIVDFSPYGLPKPFRVSSLEAPHRIVDALLRDSEIDGIPFRKSSVGKPLDSVDIRNATILFKLCPTALTFGIWDSTSERGGLGAKFQRALVSEIVGLHAVQGTRTSSRIDPAQIMVNAGKVYQAKDGGWTLEEAGARRLKDKPLLVGKSGKPSEVNHGNVTPSIVAGGFTISKAVQTTVLSLPALRRLRFPLNGSGISDRKTDLAAWTVLAAQALYAASLAREHGADLRSRCLLIPTSPMVWELLGRPGEPPLAFALSADEARQSYIQAVEEAKALGLPWLDKPLLLTPSKQLVELVRKSQQLKIQTPADEPEGA